MAIGNAGTITDLVQDATRAGYTVTDRLIRDWTAKGLLDWPQRRPSGRGRGSRPALYSPEQRELFLFLLRYRDAGLGISSLARIPVGIWLYYGPAYVPTTHAQRAFRTWLGDARVNQSRSKEAARQLVSQLASPDSTTSDKSTLQMSLADLAYRGRVEDISTLRASVGNVFDAGFGPLSRAVGDPSAPLTTDAVVALIEANLRGIERIREGTVHEADFDAARQIHLKSLSEYLATLPEVASGVVGAASQMYEHPTLESLLNHCCEDLLTIIGLHKR